VMLGYIARLKKEKEDRENTQSNGYSGSGFRNTSGNYHSNAPYRKRGAYGSYHPYQRPRAAPKFTHNSVTFNSVGSATDSRETSDTENTLQQPLKTAVHTGERQQAQPKTLCRMFTSTGISTKRHFRALLFFSDASDMSTGVCTRHGCLYLHDPDKQAVCKRWFYKGVCAMGESCSLSHAASAHNAPTCLHFQAGRCNNDDCRFAHIRINPAALNCEPFGCLGYCEKGDTCAELHAHECPNFANTGVCRYGDDCRLGHVRRAARMRKTTRPSSPTRSPSSNSPDNSDALPRMTWILPETIWNGPCQKLGADQNPQQFTQQVDFVPFDADQ